MVCKTIANMSIANMSNHILVILYVVYVTEFRHVYIGSTYSSIQYHMFYKSNPTAFGYAHRRVHNKNKQPKYEKR